jgi:hypothetical protein
MANYDPDEAGIGYGKILEYSADGTTGWVKVPGTVEFEFPDTELEAAETTNDDSPDGHKDYIPGLYEPGTVPFSYRYGKTAFALIDAVFMLATVAATRATATKFWRQTMPDGSKMAFKGFITKHSMPADIDGVLTVEGEMQCIGKRVFTPAP